MKIALIQTNPIIGDFKFNSKKIISWAHEASKKGCKLAIFPEMALSGYPPQDLLERNSFIDKQCQAIESLIHELPDIDVLFGCFEQRNADKGKKLYNSAFVARKGEIIYRARKQLLPSYDVFDEIRYFEPGHSPLVYTIGSHNFGVTICEDIWHEEIDDYDKEPIRQIVENCRKNEIVLDGIINISASPFQRHKEKQKLQMFENLCQRYNLPLIYVNQVGGQDSLLFDGRSLVMDSQGNVTAKAPGFVEEMLVINTSNYTGDIYGEVIDDEVQAVYQGLVMGVRDYVKKCGFSAVVLGLSGGIDSALTCAIAVDALGKDNVLGIALPSPYSSPESEEDARKLAENLGCRFEIIGISELFTAFTHSLEPLFKNHEDDLTEQNIQARIRGNLLMALSNKFGSLLLTTGNKSEMAVGYCTLYGDMSGGLAVISDVPKQLVYGLARYVNRSREIIPERILTKAPTAELKPDQKDQDDLPPYEILDQILELHLEQGLGFQEIVAKGFTKEIVSDVLKRIKVNEYKRKQAPLGLKVTTKAFGYGRRYPNVQNFREDI